ncbi:MAG: phosphoglucosamine mutase [Clostridia bacterium]|nr:phosphoglucosamine mutase [Clostridia bacterium]MBQ2812499.1 phosphoglucosamine mutase [Clostridia bacterium]
MTIGQKITSLRVQAGLSQEDLAEKLSVSRQSVSKWEMDQAIPQLDKALLLCDMFGISADRLLRDEIELESSTTKAKNKYFGTDGFRGEANITLTSLQAYKVGRFLGWYFSSSLSGCTKAGYRPRIVIGKDTRRSSYMLEYSIVAGITASGADAYMLHVTTTPSVSYVTRMDEFDCGIMITASHNPFYDNGIKVINRYGEKLDDNTTALIEAYLDGDLASLGVAESDLPLACKEKIGLIVDYVSGRNRYVGYLISVASNSYKKLRIGLDCANGASWSIASSVFSALGAQVTVIGNEPDGLNVNENCGSTHIENLCRLVKEQHLDMGFAFDGDCDRCIAVDEKGEVVDGDAMLYILGKRLKRRDMLNSDTVVATIMSNSGLINSLNEVGIKCAQTTVGDRFVYECMQNNDYSLGGEQSGHIILKKYATTGDGLLTAIMLTEEVCDTKSTLAKLKEPVQLYPQLTVNLRVKDKGAVLSDEAVLEAKDKVEALINGKGRALLRQSGTEPVIRVMIESESEDKCREYCDIIASVIKERGHTVG